MYSYNFNYRSYNAANNEAKREREVIFQFSLFNFVDTSPRFYPYLHSYLNLFFAYFLWFRNLKVWYCYHNIGEKSQFEVAKNYRKFWEYKYLIGQHKIYFIIDQQKERHFVHFSECLYHLPSLLCNSND